MPSRHDILCYGPPARAQAELETGEEPTLEDLRLALVNALRRLVAIEDNLSAARPPEHCTVHDT